jgi:hypothetical protein
LTGTKGFSSTVIGEHGTNILGAEIHFHYRLELRKVMLYFIVRKVLRILTRDCYLIMLLS